MAMRSLRHDEPTGSGKQDLSLSLSSPRPQGDPVKNSLPWPHLNPAQGERALGTGFGLVVFLPRVSQLSSRDSSQRWLQIDSSLTPLPPRPPPHPPPPHPQDRVSEDIWLSQKHLAAPSNRQAD